MKHGICVGCVLAIAALAPAGCDDDDAGTASDISHLDLPDNPSPPRSSFSAADHVTSARYARLILEVDSVTGHGPGASVLSDVQDALDGLVSTGHLGKPSGVAFVEDDTIAEAPPGTVYTLDDLIAIQRATRSVALTADSAAIHILYVDGAYEGDSGGGRVLGFAYGGSWIVMLKDNIEASCKGSTVLAGPLLAGLADEICDRVEASVLLHELGHIFGLVDNGTAMVNDHADPEHPHHDRNRDCLMYWLIENQGAVDLIAERFVSQGGSPLEFCPESLADLAAANGK